MGPESQQLSSIRIAQNELRGHTRMKIWINIFATSPKFIVQAAVCILLNQKIWSHFQKACNTFITESNLMNVFVTKEYVCHSLHPQKMTVVEITETQDCHDIYHRSLTGSPSPNPDTILH